uniref:LysM domain-containing protein n=1 Tax=Timema shepardi TaxID=629360 RepID=A0A7R9AX16_TIMSH|nr:unnamed protein product [Timema shepardi]
MGTPLEVEPADTLTSVAARFDTTPSELTKLNRLTTRLVFPGQVLYVPDKKGRGGGGGSEDGGESADDEDTTPVAMHPNGGGPAAFEERDFLDNLRPVSPKPLPGHIERVKTPSSPRTSATSSIDGDSEQQQLQRKVLERFLKINVRHITDGQGVVGGVLLVTPNAVMFDPNVSDPLVIEHGPESYGVIAPMEFVVNAAIYSDIAHMRVGHSSEIPKSDAPKPEIYHSKDSSNMFKSTDMLMDSMSTTCTFTANAQNSPGKDSLLVKDETFPELAPVRSSPEDNEIEDNESVCSCTGRDIIRDGDAFPKAFERDLVTPTNLVLSDNETGMSDRKDNRQLSFESSSFANQKIEADAISKSESDKSDDPGELFRCVEERRKSCLDHHWPMSSIDRSVDKESEDILTVVKSEKVVELVKVSEDDDEVNLLVKQSCHDSGIDIHEVGVTDLVAQASASANSNEPDLTNLHPITKKVYSDADIILGSEFVPPLTGGLMSMSQDSAIVEGSRKKTSSVSFSLDSNQEAEGTGMDKDSGEEGEKHETRKNKMLKRLSYPLAWMEGLTGDNKDEKEGLPALPTIDGQQHSSVFSKVFSSSPINLVDFSTGLFLAKTPSEESSKSPGPGPPPPTPAALAAGSDSDSFSSMVVDTAGAMLSGVGRSSVGTFIRQHPHPSEPKTHVPKAPPPKLDYRSMVSVDDMPELFVSFDSDHVLLKLPLRMLNPKRPRGRPTDRSESDLKISVPRTPRSFCDAADAESGKPVLKTTLITSERDSNPDLPVISSLDYCECDTLDHVTTKVGLRHCFAPFPITQPSGPAR